MIIDTKSCIHYKITDYKEPICDERHIPCICVSDCNYKTIKKLEENLEEYKNLCKQQIVDVVNIGKEKDELKQKINKVKKLCKKVGCSSQRSADEWLLAEEIETLISEVE